MDEDTLFIHKFLDGDEKGFEALVNKYQDRVLNIACSIAGKDRDGEDIAQETFLKVYYGLKSFKRNAQFSTWLYRIAVNTAYSCMRKRDRYVKDENVLEASISTDAGPKDALLIKEKQAMLKKALMKVPVKFRAAMVLKDIEGLSYAEISKVLNCRIGTVESKIYRARQFLKEELLKIEGGAI